MEIVTKELPLIVIVGPTASGKTKLAIQIAKKYRGEIICADSRTVFQEMNIGTAKPTLLEQEAVPHWGLNLVSPGVRYTAAEFQKYAFKKINEIRTRGKLPIIVGGTGLYVDGVVYDYKYPAEATECERLKFGSMTTSQLYNYCIKNNIVLPINDKNKRHLIRKIIHNGVTESRRTSIIPNTLMFGLAVDKTTLRQRITDRTEQMFENGVVDEAKTLGKKYGWNSEAMTGNIYPLVREYTLNHSTLIDTKTAFCIRDLQLAKRQMTWFRRNPHILWSTAEGCEQTISSLLDVYL